MDESEIGGAAAGGRVMQAPPSGPPTEFANVPPPPPSGVLDNRLWELHKSVSELTTKVERLLKDVEEQGTKINNVGHQISFVRGVLWVLGVLFALVTTGAGLYFKISGH